jgi:ribosome-binding factor A
MLLTEVRDPRLVGITITDVRLDREIEHAYIYVNALGEEERHDEVMEGLEKARGFLRRELASRLRLRRMPELHFQWDIIPSQAEHIEELLDSLMVDEQQGDGIDE